MAEVKRQVDVMVLKRAVLFGIEHLKQRRGRIALKALTELIDLIEQDEGVIRARLLHSRHDAARQDVYKRQLHICYGTPLLHG